jgi:hypothetical protein
MMMFTVYTFFLPPVSEQQGGATPMHGHPKGHFHDGHQLGVSL